jgi:hypothetical protein
MGRPAALDGSAGGRACTARRVNAVRDGSIPGRRGGSMVSRCLPAQGTGRRNGAGGGTRTLTSDQAQRIFIPPTAFAARTRHFGAHASGLWSGLSLHRLPENPGLRCCPSSLYTFPAGGSLRAWLGIATPAFAGASLGFPEFEQFCIAGFPDEHSSFLKSVASAGFATPAWPNMYGCLS